MTRAEAAAVLRKMASESKALVAMVEKDLADNASSPTAEQLDEHRVRLAVAKFFTLKAAVWENTCRNGSCQWKPEDLLP